VGMSMAVGMILLVLKAQSPSALDVIPTRSGIQLAVLGGLFVYRALFQWRTLRPAEGATPPARNSEKEKP
jgi:hypothetical protein